MKHQLRSATSTGGRRMAGARALWRANGMKETEMGNPIIAIVNSFTQFVPGHVHLHEIGQTVKKEIEKLGCFAAEFNTIAIDDGIAMGHDGMLYSLPSRDLIADSVEYMVNAHKADAMICISNCDKITPGMLMAAMRLNIPTIFVSGGPMEAGQLDGKGLDLIDAMVESADETISDEQVRRVEHAACPTCGSCSGMFTANSMNCLNEAIGLALPGNGTVVATHRNRERLFIQAARQIVENCRAYYQDGDESVLPRNIATRAAFLNAMTLDIAMGGSTNTVLHLLAIAQEAGVDFTIQDIDSLSRKSPVLCKVAPNSHYHIQDVNRAGGILSILAILEKEGLIDASVRRVDRLSLTEAIEQYAIRNGTCSPEAERLWKSAPGNRFNLVMGSQENTNGKNWDESTGWNGVWFIPSSDGGYGFHLPTQHLLDAFDPEDPRITWTFVRQGDQFVGNDFVTGDANYPSRFFDRKHFVPMSETLNAASPVYPQDVEMTVYVIRYADVLLMYAEACLEKGDIVGARKYLNQVRKRARESSPLDAKRVIQKYVPDTKSTSLPDITSDNVAEVRLAIWNERRFEFACEGIRRMDLMQQERYGEIMTAVYSNGYATEDVDKGRYYTKERELFPIPQNDIDLSRGALVQNPGY